MIRLCRMMTQLHSNQLPSVFEKMSKQKNTNDEQVAKFIYGCNIPFSTVDHPEFVKLVQTLKPGYKPPSSKTVGGPLLDKIFEEIKEKSKSLTRSKFATLMQDGWSGIHQAPIISHCLSLEAGTTVFLNAVATSTNMKDAEYCSELALEAIKYAEEQYHCRVGAIVTDNCYCMLAMRRIIIDKLPDIWTYGCNTHYLNLVRKTVVSDEMLQKVKDVQHFFRDRQYPRELLKKNGGLSAVLPCETRWNTNYDCLKNFVTNHTKYLDIGKDSRSGASNEILSTLTDISFYKSVEETMANMMPLVNAITKLQHERATLSYAVHHWINISKKCVFGDNIQIKFEERMDLALSPVVCAAYLLDPYYRGEDLPKKYRDRGQAWLGNKHQLYCNAQLKLEVGDDQFYDAGLMKKDILRGDLRLTGSQWWELMESRMGCKLPAGLGKLAKQLMFLPASTSSMERCFSTMGSIMTDTRNRIGIEKASKLCMIYRTLNAERLTSEMTCDVD